MLSVVQTMYSVDFVRPILTSKNVSYYSVFQPFWPIKYPNVVPLYEHVSLSVMLVITFSYYLKGINNILCTQIHVLQRKQAAYSINRII